MPLQQTSGAASYDAFGGGVAAVPKYIEEYFSTFLFTGNASTQTITNGIDLAGKGGLVWTKNRTNAYDNYLYDTARGVNKVLLSNNTIDQQSLANTLTAFNSTGFTLGNSDYGNITNGAAAVSWSIAKAPKFFDVVTYTGNFISGVGGTQTISHNLGSVPGCIIVKSTSVSGYWTVYHRQLGNNKYLELNSTNQANTNANVWNSTDPTSTQFSVGQYADVNTSGETFVAYVFAHDAGGFGLTGTDNVISCGSFTTSGGGVATVDLGYEPQWLLIKSSSGTSGWDLIDNMRGMPNLGTYGDAIGLEANNSNAEGSRFPNCYPTATGFYYGRAASTTYIYIAIRRGPMKVPTSGTSVFLPSTAGATTPFNVGFPPDLALWSIRDSTGNKEASTRLQGEVEMFTNTTGAETSVTGLIGWNSKTNFWFQNITGGSMINWMFRRAPSFFDEVCYTGTGSARTIAHNLTVAPELMIVKCRSTARAWPVYAAPLGNTEEPRLNESSASGSSTSWNSTTPTSSVFSVSNGSIVNASGDTYVAYLFATCAGVSKVGSYTGTATTKQIDCGFTAGARFVLIKRTDSTGDWYVWDSARGIVSGNDPYLLLNSTAAEDTTTDYIDTYSAGFEISSTAPAAINASGGTYIFLAIA